MATLPQGNQELLVVKDKVGRPPGEFGVVWVEFIEHMSDAHAYKQIHEIHIKIHEMGAVQKNT